MKTDKLKPVFTLVINWSKNKWDGPTKLSEMLEEVDPCLQKYVNDYELILLDPHTIDDFEDFTSELGDVLEFIKRQNDKNYLKNMVSEKGTDWELDLKTVNAINTFTGAKIPVSNAKEGNVVKMCEATKALVDEGIEIGVKEGVKKGVKQGADLINELNNILIAAGRMDDLTRAARDPKYQKKLIKELLPEKSK